MPQLKAAFTELGLQEKDAEKLNNYIQNLLTKYPPNECWQILVRKILSPRLPFGIHLLLYKTLFPNWDKEPPPVWIPSEKLIRSTNIGKWMLEKGHRNLQEEY